jgi:TP901 family phage tail tape measure protein
MSAGSQMLLGIRLQLDAEGLVTGASVAESSLQKIQNNVHTTQRKVSEAGNAMKDSMNASLGVGALGTAAMGVGKALDAAITPAIDQAKSFQVEMSQLRFVSKATEDELMELEQVALKTGLETQFSPQEAAAAIRMLKAAGLSTETSLKSLSATLDTVTGSAGLLDLQTGATATAAALLKFSHTGETARDIMDTFANATRETNLQFHDLPIFINSLRDAPAKIKATSSEAIALVGVLKNAGMQAAQAGQTVDMFANKFLVVYRRLEKYLEKNNISEQDLLAGYTDKKMPQTVKAFQKLGVSMFDVNGNLKNMTQFFGELIDASTKLSGESAKSFLVTASTVFGARGGPLITALRDMKRGSLTGRAAFEDLVHTLEKSGGASREAAKAFEDTQVGLEVFIQGTKDTINIALGKTLIPYLHKFGGVWKKVLGAFLEFIENNPTFAKALMGTAAALMIAAKVAGLVILAFAGLLFWSTVVSPAIAAAGGAAGIAAIGFGALQAMLWPLILIAGAVAVVFVALYGVIKIFKYLMTGNLEIAKSFQRLMKTFSMIKKGITELWSGEEGKEQTVKALKAMGLYGIVTTIIGIKNRIVAVFSGFVDGLIYGFKSIALVLYPVQLVISYVIDAFRRLFESWGPMKDVYEVAKGWRAFGFILGWIASVVLTALIVKVSLLALPFVILAAKVLIVAAVIYGIFWILRKIFVGLGTLIGWVAFKIYQLFVWLREKAFAFGVYFYVAFLKLKVSLVKLAVGIFRAVANPIAGVGIFIRDSFNNAVGYLMSLKTRAAQAASGFIQAFFDAIQSRWEAVKEWFSGALQWIRDRLPGSDAKVGPLSTLTRAGQGFSQAFGEGIEQGAPELQGRVTRVLEGTAPDGEGLAGAYAKPDGVLPKGEGADDRKASITNSRGGTVITIQKMEFNVAEATPEEAESLAEQIIERIRTMLDEEQEVGFV